MEQRYNYDSHARVSDVTDGRGQSSHYDYDAAGNRVGARDAQQRQTSRRYNAQNQLISETIAGVGTTRRIYDASGLHLRFSVSAEGRVPASTCSTASRLRASGKVRLVLVMNTAPWWGLSTLS
nr:RHS repeat domain-containing protein [Chromobacterium violaceum]